MNPTGAETMIATEGRAAALASPIDRLVIGLAVLAIVLATQLIAWFAH